MSRTQRPSPSAGALHSIEIVLFEFCGKPRVARYLPHTNEIEFLKIERPDRLDALAISIREILPSAHGTGLFFLGDIERIAAVYENSLSLIWRDAGALLQTLFLSATAFELEFCPIGILGQELPDALGLGTRLTGMGGAIIGRK